MSRLIGEKTKEIVLAHLSREANTKELALGTYQEVFSQQGVCCEKLQIKVASQVDIVIGGKEK